MCDSTRDLRLDQIIADYLEAAAAGRAPSDAQWLAAHPNEADALREFLADYRGVDGVVSASCDDAGGAPASGRRFGDYELLEEIGRGGMGVIHKARQRGLDRVVAVKTILDGQLASAEQVQRFQREARSAARLEHPNIVTVHEVGVQDGLHFFSMAYVDGRPLSELTRERPLPPRDAARLVKAIAGAIAYAHSQGVLHRDLKPSNILVDADGEPRITDFGLAKLAGESLELTVTGAVVGTPAYMPPEQAAGRIREVGAASDVYSIGAILYTALTGSPPFSGETAAEVVNNVVHGRVTPPRLINAAVPDALQVICLRCLEQAPARRYSSARELEEDLRRYLDGEPILARPPGYLERAWRWTRRRNLAGRLKLAASTWGLFIGLALAALFWGGHRAGLPLLDPTRPLLDDVAGVAALMAVWWLSEAIPLAGTALLPLVLFPLLGVMPAATVARHYGDDVIFLFLGGFLVALAVEDSGLPRRVALRIIAALGDSPRRIVLAFMIATGLLSMWTSNSAVTIMMLPIAIGLLEEVERDLSYDTRALGPALMLGIAYAASIAGTATVIGSPVNVAALAQAAGIEISFTQWMSVGLPFAALQLGATWALLAYRLFPLGAERLEGGQVAALRELQRLGTMKPAEKRALAVFALTALLWIFRAPHEGWGWGPAIFGVDHEALVSDGTVAVAMALLCLIVPDGTPTGRLLRWEATARMPWGVLFLFGGGLALAAGMRQGGLVDLLDDHLAAGLGALTTGSALAVLAGAILLLAGYAAWARGQARRPAAWGETLLPPGLMAGAWVALAALRGPLGALLLTVAAMTTLTEIFTNLATVELVTRVLANAAEQLDLGRPLVLASTMAASCAFLLPVSTTPNAVVFGSRRVSARQMARAGFWVDVVGAFVLIAVLAAYVRLT